MGGKNNGKNSAGINTLILVFSIAAGIIGLLISVMIYMHLKDNLWSPLAVGISFSVFTVVFIIFMSIVNAVFGLKGKGTSHRAESVFVLILFIVGTFVFGTLFEFIYEIDFFDSSRVYNEPTSYVFLIDNSGSMETNDPESFRYEAIKEIVADRGDDFPYAVYGFSNDIHIQRELAPANKGQGEMDTEPGGGTEIRKALEKLFEEYSNGLKKKMGKNPKVLLLSDGVASDVNFFSHIEAILSKYSKEDLPISTVGLGDYADTELLQKIADETGGVYVSSQDIDQLESAMQSAISRYSEDRYVRTLYTRRIVPALDWLYAIMRIVFLGILSIGISLSMLFVAKESVADEDLIVVSSVITGILAALVMELGINFLNGPPSIIKAIFFVLTALTFVHEFVAGGSGKGTDVGDMSQWDTYTVRGTGDQKALDEDNAATGAMYGGDNDSSWDDF